MAIVGIDISKDDFHACLLHGPKRARKSFPNSSIGHRQMLRWLTNRGVNSAHVCMESTGSYHLPLAIALYKADLKVSVVPPSRTVMFARSQLRRTKTDAVDAEMLAEFCKSQRPNLWQPPSKETLDLRAFLSYRNQLVTQRTALRQLMEQVATNASLKRLQREQLDMLNQMVAGVEEQMEAYVKRHGKLKADVTLVRTIPGVGFLSAVAIVARVPMERLRNGKAAAAYAGLTPADRQSGTSVRGKPRICKTGNAELRRDLYMPAISAIRSNPTLKAFAERLKAKGKPPKVAIVAVMRKLLVLAYALLKSGTAYDPALAA